MSTTGCIVYLTLSGIMSLAGLLYCSRISYRAGREDGRRIAVGVLKALKKAREST